MGTLRGEAFGSSGACHKGLWDFGIFLVLFLPFFSTKYFVLPGAPSVVYCHSAGPIATANRAWTRTAEMLSQNEPSYCRLIISVTYFNNQELASWH